MGVLGVATSVLLCGCTTWTLPKHLEKMLDGNDKNTACCFKQILEAAPTKQQLYGHLPPI